MFHGFLFFKGENIFQASNCHPDWKTLQPLIIPICR